MVFKLNIPITYKKSTRFGNLLTGYKKKEKWPYMRDRTRADIALLCDHVTS